MSFGEVKVLLSEMSTLHKDALHVHVALLIYLLVLFAKRLNLVSMWPFIAVLVIGLANEAYDLIHMEAHGEAARWGESLKDLVNTMIWPTIFFGLSVVLFRRRETATDEKRRG